MANVLQIQAVRRKIENHYDAAQIGFMEATGFYIGETIVKRITPSEGARSAYAATCEGSLAAIICEWETIDGQPRIWMVDADTV